jgi:tRNA nucleotidyltransferase (CCA-adding enzyme)
MKNSLSEILNKLPFVDEVSSNGGKIYAVGGPVRDYLLNLISKDLDIIITGISYDLLYTILCKYGYTKLVGESFGIIKFKCEEFKEEIDISLPRTERKIGDKHTDFIVTINPDMSIEEEMLRRDITINSMAMDLNGNIIDPYNGVFDIENKLIRATSKQSFIEDPLRILRCIQFATRFNFIIENDTFELIKSNTNLVSHVSKERIIIEIEKIIKKGSPKKSIDILLNTDVFKYIFDVDFNGSIELFENIKYIGEYIFCCYKNSNLNMRMVKNLFGSSLQIFDFKIMLCLEMLENYSYNMDKYQKLQLFFNVEKILKGYLENTNFINQADKQLLKNYPIKDSDLKINGLDLYKLGFEPGIIYREIFDLIYEKIFKDELLNIKEKILEFINEYKKSK